MTIASCGAKQERAEPPAEEISFQPMGKMNSVLDAAYRRPPRWRAVWTVALAAMFLLTMHAFAAAAASAPEQDLLSPPATNDQPIGVTVGVYVVNLAALDEVKETFQLNGYLKATWSDPRLAFSVPAGSTQRPRRYREDEIWHPRLSMMNAAAPRDRYEITIHASPDGTVSYIERFVVTLSATFNVHRFPFDSQNLIIDLQPTPADRDIVNVMSRPDLLRLNQANYVGMAQWRILGLSQRTTQESVGGTSDQVSQVEMNIQVKRRFGFYIWKVFVPLFLMVAVSWTIFWMSLDDFGNQILVAVTTILTIIAFAFAIESNLPKVPYVTYIDAFFLCCYIFVFLSVLELMAVNVALRNSGRGRALKIRRFACWFVPTVFILLNAILIPHFFLQ